MKTLTAAALCGAQPLVTRLEPQPPSTAKEAVSSGVSGMVDVAKGAVQGSVEMTCFVVAEGVNSVMGSRVGEMITADSTCQTWGGRTLENGQEQLHQMWLVWSQRHPGKCRPLDPSAQPEVESRALAMFHGLTRQMQLSYLTLMSQLRGLPTSLQDKVKLIWHMMEDLNGSFLAASSFQEVPSPATLAQSCQRFVKARGSVDEIVDYVAQNVPLPWVVGPFAPILVELPYASSMEGNEKGEDPPRPKVTARKERKENSKLES
ncbi:hypothetical protein E2320_000005 [Naja naja]|nr:hypothetical protein E2320_000005 [Naja naja]